MSKSRRLAIAVIIVCLAAGAAFGLYRWLHRPAGGQTLTLYGNVDIRESQPAFNDIGRVTQMLVSEGARVKKGELLARIEDARYGAAQAQAQQHAQSLKADLAALLHGSRPQQIARARAAMRALRAVYENDRAVYARTAALLPQGVASTEERDDARARVRAASENYQAARQSYLLAVQGPRREEIAAARHAYDAAVAATALAAREFADTRLYAPADGTVEDRILEPGDMASPGVPVYTIALTSPLWVRAYLPEKDLGRVRPGMAATVGTDSYPGRLYHGWIGYLSPTSEFTPKTVQTAELRTALVYQLRVFVCDAQGQLRLGMPATVHIDLRSKAPTASPGCGPADVRRP